jgi:predicted MPP superfamily phosphohydrolase
MNDWFFDTHFSSGPNLTHLRNNYQTRETRGTQSVLDLGWRVAKRHLRHLQFSIMFLLRQILFCAPLIIYAGFRIWTLIPQRLFKILFTIIYLLLIVAFPLAETLSHRSGMEWAHGIRIGGYFSLPLLLYIMLSVIVLDMALGVALLTRVVSKETVRQRRFRRAWLFLILVIPVAVVLVGAVRNNRPQIREYSIEVPQRSSQIRQLKIAFSSDFHLRETTSRGFMDRFVERVNAANPDIVLIGGDVLEGDRQGERLGEFETQFRQLKAKYGVYGVAGNHDSQGVGTDTFFDRAGIRLLQDTVEKVGNAFYLVGRNDGRWRSRKSIHEIMEDCDGSLPVIVLEHRPTDLDQVSRSGADILLAGHTHNGQLFPVNVIALRQYELSWGYKLKNRTHVFVTSGVQVWGPPVRTAGVSEILVINVTFVDGKGVSAENGKK